MIQECEQGVGLDIVQGEVSHGLALLICQEQIEELQRVAVGSHGMHACSARLP
jgi:hypothetical protein